MAFYDDVVMRLLPVVSAFIGVLFVSRRSVQKLEIFRKFQRVLTLTIDLLFEYSPLKIRVVHAPFGAPATMKTLEGPAWCRGRGRDR